MTFLHSPSSYSHKCQFNGSIAVARYGLMVFTLCACVQVGVCVDLKALSALHSFPSCSCNFPLRGDLLLARSSLSRLGWPWGSTGPHPHPFSAAPALELQVCDTPHPLSLLFWGWDADGTPYACKLSTLPTELSPQPLF